MKGIFQLIGAGLIFLFIFPPLGWFLLIVAAILTPFTMFQESQKKKQEIIDKLTKLEAESKQKSV